MATPEDGRAACARCPNQCCKDRRSDRGRFSDSWRCLSPSVPAVGRHAGAVFIRPSQWHGRTNSKRGRAGSTQRIGELVRRRKSGPAVVWVA